MKQRLLNTLLDTIAAVPRKRLLAWGRSLGHLWFEYVPVRRRWTLAHICAAMPELTPEEAIQLGREVFIEQATNVLELLAYRKLLTEDNRALSHFQVSGAEHVTHAKAHGRGLIILTAHIGNYDLLAAHQALSGERLNVVSKTLSSTPLNTLWMNIRRELRIQIIPLENVVSTALSALRRGEAVALVLDQHSPEPRAHESLFLGLPARTSQALALLALRSKAPILPCFIRRTQDGTHRIEFLPHFHPPTQGSTREKLASVTETCLRHIETAIRQQPNQWLWLHRRWKSADGQPLIRPEWSRQGKISITASSTTAS